jgi:hypothetical protein
MARSVALSLLEVFLLQLHLLHRLESDRSPMFFGFDLVFFSEQQLLCDLVLFFLDFLEGRISTERLELSERNRNLNRIERSERCDDRLGLAVCAA